mgnify:FL=1|tara:strand:- start:453 stop:698 length:246 start_codon:yes stop_codon:yes gene_type:complete
MKGKKVKMIHERNPDTGIIKSRVAPTTDEIIAFNRRQIKDTHCHFDENQKIILDEIWDSPKVNHQGHWYVRLSDVVRIIEQ